MESGEILLETSVGPVSGVAAIPAEPRGPLIVAVPGGGYNARYFDVEGYSLLRRGLDNGFAVIALDRPGYGQTPLPAEKSFAGSAAAISAIIADLWEDHDDGSCPGVVVVSHSVGSAITMHIAAAEPSWPLLGIALNGVAHDIPPSHAGAWDGVASDQPPLVLDDARRRDSMYGPDETIQADIMERAHASTSPAPVHELFEITGGWADDVAAVAHQVRVPVHCRIAEFEQFWVPGAAKVAEFAELFDRAAAVDAREVLATGHNIDHHFAGPGLHLEQLAFAWNCGVGALAPMAS
jgi:pimeloyl-ACP methyl ester carboxylesterase